MKTQREIPIVGSVSNVQFAPSSVVKSFKSFADAVQWAWENRPCHGLAEQDDQALCARLMGLHAPHMSRCVNRNSKAPMNLSPDLLPAFESYTGWKAPSQYIASKAQMTVLEQLIEEKRIAA